jgi:hypothetical protein
MHMDRDKGFVFDSFDFGQICCRYGNQRVQEVQEPLICGLHNFLVDFGIVYGVFGFFCPNHLYAQKTDLNTKHKRLENNGAKIKKKPQVFHTCAG